MFPEIFFFRRLFFVHVDAISTSEAFEANRHADKISAPVLHQFLIDGAFKAMLLLDIAVLVAMTGLDFLAFMP